MRKSESQDIMEWAEQARIYELEIAKNRIAKGENEYEVMTDMSKRLSKKLLHPIIDIVKIMRSSNYDPIKAQKNYEENYLCKTSRVPDHVSDNY